MRPIRQIALFAAGAAVLLVAAPPLLQAASEDGSSNAGAVDLKAELAARDAVKKAASALEKEYEAHLDQKTAPLRAESNFFTENSNPAVTPTAIVEALSRSDGDEAASVYVHWQLLSGLPETVDTKLAPALTDVYEDAPIGPMRPGLDPGQKAEYARAVAMMPENQAEAINTDFQKVVSQWEESTKPFTRYRDALAKHLTPSFALVRAEERDAVERASNGIDGDATMSKAMETGKTWATGKDGGKDASRQQIAQIVGDVTSLLREIGDKTALLEGGSPLDSPLNSASALGLAQRSAGDLWTVGRVRPLPKPTATFPPQFFTEVEWDAKKHSLVWKTGSAKFASKEELVDFRKALIDAARQPDSTKSKGDAGAS